MLAPSSAARPTVSTSPFKLEGNATNLLSKGFGGVVDPLNPQALLIFVHLNDTRLAHRHDESVQRHPSCSIHVDVMLILDVLIVHCVGPDSVGGVRGTQKHEEVLLELPGEFCDGLSCFGSYSEHLAHMRLRSRVGLALVYACIGTPLPTWKPFSSRHCFSHIWQYHRNLPRPDVSGSAFLCFDTYPSP